MAQFRTKARAVELLGKGQIADLPTAISELWKNGYDAYADELSCDLYMNGYKDITDPIFVLSDTGFGMSMKDVLEKWIVLGTDSKARGMTLLSNEQRFGLKQRVPMGEKGIGRLSVSYLGTPMMMVTKKKGDTTQVLLFDWRILENYNLFVDDVNIPLLSFRNIDDLVLSFESMRFDLLDNINSEGAWSDQFDIANDITGDVLRINIPNAIKEEVLNKFADPDYHGTSFIVFKPHEQLLELSNYDSNEDSDSLWEIRRSLGAMFNIFAYNPDFSTEFNIRNSSGIYNIINDFFDKKDFELADHYIKGHFDENGFFSGLVRVYNETFSYSFHPIRLPGRTPYGPFDLELGVIERQQSNSMLNVDSYSLLESKVSRFGGLYIYRDLFRVLPYGRVDYDFLKFEERLSKRHGDYFFTYNKMFGYLGITREYNRNLTDKAGREGFIENKAYREFKKDLIAFFIDIAKVYFANTDKSSENARLKQQAAIRQRNEKMAEIEKKNSLKARKEFIDKIRQNSEETQLLYLKVIEMKEVLSQVSADTYLSYAKYREFDDELDSLRSQLRHLRIKKPQRISLTERQQGIYGDYNAIIEQTSANILECSSHIDQVRKRFDTNDLKSDFTNRQAIAIANIGKAVTMYKKQVTAFAQKMEAIISEEQRDYIERFKEDVNGNLANLQGAEDYRNAIKKVIDFEEQIKDEIDEKIRPFVDHLNSLSLDVNDDILVSWYKEQKAKVEEKLDYTTSLAQLGISVEIIDHQFNVLYSQMSSSMKLLKGYAEEHAELIDTYRQMHNAFEHMEQNYKMLRPLYRSSQRRRSEFTGKSIFNNLCLFFKSNRENLGVKITTNTDFENHKFFAFESDILSVFINILNNAFYWLIPVSKREIRIEYDSLNENIIIMNSGTPIPDADLEKIFMLFYTKRKDGRGIGLYLTQKTLAANNYKIFATNSPEYNKLGGACFVIAPERSYL